MWWWCAPWCWCGCGELMAEGQRGTTLQCMAVCVCGLNMGGVWLDGGRFVTTTNANTTQLMGFVAMTAPQPSGVTDVCVCGRVCCGVCAWWCRFGKCWLLWWWTAVTTHHKRAMAPCCGWCCGVVFDWVGVPRPHAAHNVVRHQQQQGLCGWQPPAPAMLMARVTR